MNINILELTNDTLLFTKQNPNQYFRSQNTILQINFNKFNEFIILTSL